MSEIIQNIIALNVNSVKCYGRRVALELFLSQHKADIIFLSETNLKPSNTFHVSNYSVFRHDRTASNGGGVAILLNQFVKTRNIRKFSGVIEAISIEAFLDNQWILLISIYIPPPRANSSALNVSHFANIFNTNLPVIAGGDLNARHVNHGDISNNHCGISLHSFINNSEFHLISPISPTCFRSEHGSFIDHFIISRDFFPFKISASVLPSFSDHFAIIINHSFTNLNSTRQCRTFRAFNFTNVGKMNSFLNRSLDQLSIPTNANLSHNELEAIANRFQDIFVETVERFVPVISIPTGTIFLSTQTRAINRERRRIGNILCKKRFTSQLPMLRSNLRMLNTMFMASLKNDLCSAYRNILLDTKHNRNIYELAKRVKFRQNRPDIGNISLVNSNGENAASIFEINEALASHFESSHGLTFDTSSEFDTIVESSVADLHETDFLIPFNATITPNINLLSDLAEINTALVLDHRNFLTCQEEIINIVKSRLNKKSAGSDELPIYLFKFFDDQVFTKIAIFFNHLIATGYFPRIWTFANVTPIPKPGRDCSLIANWRPISQLNTISKVFERVICCRLNRFIEREDVLPNHQFGFRSNRSTVHPVAMIFNDISTNLNNRKATTMVTLDIQSAFDTVWHAALLHKLIVLKFPIGMIKIIAGFIGDRTFAVGNFPNRSNVRLVKAGVPQGSVLGPILFNLYLYDIPTHARIRLLQFADDIALYFGHTSALTCRVLFNRYLSDISKYYRNWKLKLNNGKTEMIHFVGQGSCVSRGVKNKLRNFFLTLDKTKISSRSNIKYLGVIFSSNFRFNAHIDHIIKKFFNSYGSIKGIVHSRFLNPKLKLFVYKTYLRPIFQYAAAVWVNDSVISSFQMERLRIAERKIVRAATNSHRERGSYKYIRNSELYRKSSIDRIDNHLIKIIVNFFYSVSNSVDEFLRGIVEPFRENVRFHSCAHIFHLHCSGRLLSNDLMLMFNKAKRNPQNLVYSTAQ